MVGPAIAGIMVTAWGEGWCFFANGVSYLGVILGLLLMNSPKDDQSLPVESHWKNMGLGFRYVWHTKTIRGLVMLLAVVSLVGMPYVVLMPIFADRVLHGGPRSLGILMGATGAGAVLSAFTLAVRRGVQGLDRWIATCALGFSATLMAFSVSRSFWLSVGLLLVAGFCLIGQTASSNTLVQTLTPDNLRGRVMAVYSMMFIGVAPFGSLLAGLLAHWLGAPGTLTVAGFDLRAIAVIFRRQFVTTNSA